MRIVKEGETGKAVCQDCGLSSITYRLRDVDFSDQSGTVKNILAGVCDQCGEVATIPRQSTPQVRAEFDKVRKSIETRVPAHYIDILNLAIRKISHDLEAAFHKNLILYYINGMEQEKITTDKLKELLNSDLASAPASKRVSLKISERMREVIEEVRERAGLKSVTDLLKGVILMIYEDIVQQEKETTIKELQMIASAF